MDEPETSKSSRSSGSARRRRANVPGGRHHRHEVKVTPEEEAVLLGMALKQRVTIPRLLVEAALSGGAEQNITRQQTVDELFKINRLLASIANNMNQIAAAANTAAKAVRGGGQVQEDVVALVAEELPRLPATRDAVKRAAMRIEDTLDELSL